MHVCSVEFLIDEELLTELETFWKVFKKPTGAGIVVLYIDNLVLTSDLSTK